MGVFCAVRVGRVWNWALWELRFADVGAWFCQRRARCVLRRACFAWWGDDARLPAAATREGCGARRRVFRAVVLAQTLLHRAGCSTNSNTVVGSCVSPPGDKTIYTCTKKICASHKCIACTIILILSVVCVFFFVSDKCGMRYTAVLQGAVVGLICSPRRSPRQRLAGPGDRRRCRLVSDETRLHTKNGAALPASLEVVDVTTNWCDAKHSIIYY